ncbi:MAG: NHL repeat-containing protein, partial [Candidatus Poribacteria bacterium]
MQREVRFPSLQTSYSSNAHFSFKKKSEDGFTSVNHVVKRNTEELKKDNAKCNLNARNIRNFMCILGCAALLFASITMFSEALESIKFDVTFGGKGSGGGGFGKNIHINFDADNNIYISDADNKVVQKLSPDGQFIMQIPKEKPLEPLFEKPGDICVDSDGNIYVADTTATHIQNTENPKIYIFAPCVYKFNPQGELIKTFFVDKVDVYPKTKTALPARVIIDENGQPAFGIQPKGYDRPLLVDVDSKNNLYALDVKNAVVFKLTEDGSEILHFGQYGAGAGEFDDPSDIEIDRQDNIFIADKGNNRVLKFNSEGQFRFALGKKGRGNAEFVKPLRITVMRNGEILVKDSSQFVRALHQHPFYESSGISGEGDVSYRTSGSSFARSLTLPFARGRTLNQAQVEQSELEGLRERLRLLEEAEYYRYYYEKENGDKDDGKEKEEDEEKKAYLIKKTIYHNVIERIQRFSGNGGYRGRVIYKIDKQSEEDHDLSFLAIDPLGRIYLRDDSELTIRRYTISDITISPAEIDAVYTARPEYSDNNFLEDYEDIDTKPNLKDEEGMFNISQSLLLNYDLSERWNLTFRDTALYGNRDNRYFIAPKQEDSYNYGDEGIDNTFRTNLKFVTNPNVYKYKELNLYSQVLYGTTNLHSDSIFTDLNKQKSRHEGNAKALIFGIDWDIFTKA